MNFEEELDCLQSQILAARAEIAGSPELMVISLSNQKSKLIRDS